MPKRSVLVVDDEDFVRESLLDLLTAEGFETQGAASAEEALQLLAEREPSVVVTDLKMTGDDGLSLVREARRRGLQAPVIVLTGMGTIPDAVEAMRLGAFDFIQKPVNPEHFARLVERAAEHTELVTEVSRLRSSVERLEGPKEIVGSSRALCRVRELIAQVAPTDAPVLVVGESGTGKELVALAIHRLSPRARGSLVRINCAAIPESLFESELFGHRKGAFTSAASDRKGRFAEADGGTLVLDEIGTLKLDMQAKLLRTLETGEYQVIGESRVRTADIRVIASTNEDLDARVQDESFRLDLFYRLNIFPIVMPPLREHREDLAAIAAHLLDNMRWSRGATPAAARLPPEALAVLCDYPWPGNVRELRNVLERACILVPEGPLPPEIIRSVLESASLASSVTSRPQARGADRLLPEGSQLRSPRLGSLCLREQLEGHEKRLIVEALERAGGRKGEAAGLLGIDPRNLGYYIRKHGLVDGGEEGTKA